jgi:large repetitive protein
MAPFATVVGIKGSGAVFAVDSRGNSRALKVGDGLQKGETVRTTGDAVVQLLMMDGSLLAVVPGQTVRLDEQVIDTDQRPGAADSAIATPAAIAAVIEALKSGADLSEALDAAAAGPAGGAGGNDGGHSFVRLLRIQETVGPQEYAFGFRAPGPLEHERGLVLLQEAEDDQPSATLSARGSILVDETTDLNATRSAQLVSVTAVTGADSAGASSNVELLIDRADTALRTTDGHAVTLVRGASDNEVVGMFDSNGDGVLDRVAFTIALTDEGTVSVTQLVALRHPDAATLVAGDTSSYDEAVTLDGNVSVRVTVVDGDGDVATVTEPIGGRIAFADDGPSVDVAVATGAQLPPLVTQDADTVGAAFDIATGATSFAGLFTITANAGADLAGSVQAVDYLLAIGEGKATTGLTSNGSAITLVMDGADIVGRIAADGGTTDIFRVSVDGDGKVTLTQYAQVDHLPEDLDAVNDNGLIGLAAGSILLRATASLTDGDQDKVTDTQAVDITTAVRFGDDLPSVSAGAVADGAIGLTTQDAQTIVAASDTASASFAAAFLAAAAPIYGADGPGSTSISGYTLAVLNANSGLTSGGEAITLAMDGSDVVGSTSNGAIFRISVDGNGTVTLTQYAQIDHLPEDLDTNNDNTSIALASGLVSLSATATTADFDNDTATATVSADLGGNIAFDDDVPSVSAITDAGFVLTTQDAQTLGAASDTASASFAAGFLAAASPIYGADGPGSTTVGDYTLAVLNANSGLTSGGQAITLAMDGSDVLGSTAAGAVFRIGVDSSGTVTLTQYAQVDHLPEDLDASNDNANIALAAGLVTLSATATTADFDNDTDTATVSTDLGGNIAFDDDLPTVSARAVADGAITLTTQDGQTIGVASDSASASFAAAFLAAAASTYGADGPGSTTVSGYTLAVLNANSGLTSGGLAVTLSMDGSDVLGSTAAGAVFRISVDASGTVTLTQYAQIDHLPEDLDASNDNANIALASGLVTLSATATTSDFDNDTATATVSADLGGNIAFDDDVPSVSAAAVADGGIVLTTQDAQTIGAASDTASASFAAAFLAAATPIYGADGPGSTSIGGYTLAVLDANSGLTSGGQGITLAMDGTDVVGSTGGGAVFRISVDASGTVTLTQYAQLDHLPEDLDGSNDNASIALAAGLVRLSATATTADFDNDQAAATVSADLGGNITFDDDSPNVSTASVADGSIVLATQDAQTIGAASDTASASFAAAFLAAAASTYGADGPGSTTVSGYTLAVLNANSGFTSGGLAITLTTSGGDVVGSTSNGAIFRISVDANGTVTLTQYAQVDHLPEVLDGSNDNTSVSLASGLVTLTATATTSDFDNDTATVTVSADLGGNIAFDDDLPSVSAAAVADGGIVLTTQDAQTIGVASDTASASFAAAFLTAAAPIYGADGPGSTTVSGYALAVLNTSSGLTSGGLAITLGMEGSDVVGSTSGGAIFRISVDASGTVTLTQYAQVDHLPEDLDASNDNTSIGLAAGLVRLSATATTADFDNDQATATVSADLGGNIAFDDDVPSVSAASLADGSIVLTTQDAQTIGLASDTASASFAAAFLAAAASTYGADGPGSTTVGGYALAVLNANSGLTSGGQAITLAMDGSDVVGSTSGGAIFRISVDASGTVTLTQYVQVDHLPEDPDGSNDNTSISLAAGLVTLSATATTSDFDNDTATAAVSTDLGGNIAFDDDLPSVSAAAVADGNIVLTTEDAQTIGAASDTASASFAAAFLAAAVSTFGADGAGSTTVSGYTLAVLNATSGLTSGGLAITVAMDGNDVVGSTAAGAIFRISVDANGTVTLTQYAQLDHLPEDLDASNDNASITLAAGLVTLSATATTSDFDNDQAKATMSADLGGNIAFVDDAPSVSAAAVADGGIVLTTQDAQTIGAASDTASSSFAAAFLAAAASTYGADGAGSISISGYALTVVNANSGLTSGGLAITLAIDGSDVVGSTSGGAIFRISVDGDGTVTLTQYAQLDHLPEDLDASNDNSSIALTSGLVTLSATATTTDFDNDTATTTVSTDLGGNITFVDDVPSVIDPVTAYVVNVAGSPGIANDIPLDLDASIDDNAGADTPSTVRFLEANGSDSGYTTGTQPIYLYVSPDGQTLIGSTLAGSTYALAWADRATTGTFVVTLDAAGSTDSYDFQLLRQIDGGAGSFSTLQGSWDFEGGNTNYVYFEDVSGRNLPNLLITPASGTRMNGTANELGVTGGGGGQNVGSGEVMRVDFVTNVTGTPKATNYVSPADHQFDEHVLVNGAAVTIAISGANATATINFRAFDDADWVDATPGEDDIVGDYAAEATTASEQIVKVTVNDVTYTADTTVGGLAIDFKADGSVTISGLRDADRVAIFTQDGFSTAEYAFAGGVSFALRGFGASLFDPGDLVTLNFDIGVVDADNDMTVVTDGLRIQLSPDNHVVVSGDANDNTLTAPSGQAATLLGLAGNDSLTGSSGDDLLVGGAGDDTLAGGTGSDTALFVDATAGVTVDLAAGTATGEGTDALASIENAFGSSFDDDLTGSSVANTLEAGGGNDTLAGDGGHDTLVGGRDTDTLAGGAGNDVLSGGTGVLPDTQSDVFEWHLGDQGSVAAPAVDVITDFSMGANGDALDLRDLLQGEASGTGLAAAQSLGQYLHFTQVGGMAVLQVDHDGGSFAATQTITFENMSLAELTASLGLPGGSTDVQIIQQMLEQGNLRNGP